MTFGEENNKSITETLHLQRFYGRGFMALRFLRYTITDWLKTKTYATLSSNQSKTKTIVTRSHMFSRALRQLHVI